MRGAAKQTGGKWWMGWLFVSENATFAQSQAKQTCRKSLVHRAADHLASCMLWGRCQEAKGALSAVAPDMSPYNIYARHLSS